MTKPITTAEINAKIQITMSEADKVKFAEGTYRLFQGQKICYYVTNKLTYPDLSEAELQDKSHMDAWEFMKANGYKYSSLYNGWLREGMDA